MSTTSTSWPGSKAASGVEGARGPDLAGEFDAAAAAVDPFQDDGLRALQRVDAGGELGPVGAVSGGDRAYDRDQRDGDDDEDQDLGHDAAAERRATAAATAPTANIPNSGIAVSTSGMPSPTAPISHHTHASMSTWSW